MNMIRAVVSNGKIEIDAPADCRDGEAVSIYLMPHGIEDGEMTGEEKQQLLNALDRFESLVPKSEELAENLSEVVRLIALEEKKGIAAYSDKLKGMFD